MTRTELESFLAVVQAGSLSAAARSLYITQPALAAAFNLWSRNWAIRCSSAVPAFGKRR